MPNITFDGPKIVDVGKKRELIKAVTDAAVLAYGLPKQAMVYSGPRFLDHVLR